MGITIRPASREDLGAVLSMWEEADVEPTRTDNMASLEQLIAHDPGSLLVAYDRDRMIGSVIAAWDGWRGSVYRLAVASSHRRRGLGRELVRHAELRLAGQGAGRLQAIVVEPDARATSFWRASDWHEQAGRRRFVKG